MSDYVWQLMGGELAKRLEGGRACVLALQQDARFVEREPSSLGDIEDFQARRTASGP